jgi:hypothetical protein
MNRWVDSMGWERGKRFAAGTEGRNSGRVDGREEEPE